MASASDVPLKTYKPLYSRDLLKGKVAFVTGKGLCVRLPAAVGAWLVASPSKCDAPLFVCAPKVVALAFASVSWS